ncbi:MAG TPA: prohibitin family protein [Candidatus Limnocylindrales bacterium]|nr:prohibitin family protein [Candidatus Limnocylindrales bacterium]
MSVSALFGFVALLGVAALIGGIALAVLAASQGRPVRNGVMLAIVGVVIGILGGVLSQGILVVQPAERAVVFNTLSGSLETPRLPGTNIIVPVLQQATLYDMSQKQYTMSGQTNEGARSGDDAVRARTIDGQEVQMDITVLYSIDPDQVNIIHQRWQNRYEDDFIRPTTRGFVRDIVSAYRADDIYGERRGEMEDRIQAQLTTRMTEEGLILSDLLVRDINFSDLFTQAIEQAQIAEQEANRARLRVQQIQQEAEQARAQAEGQRDATIARAQGEAESIVLRAQAEAEGLRLVSQQIAANPALIQYQYIQTLGPNVRLITVPSNSPFLFDLNSLTEIGDPDFVPPPVPTAEPIVPTPTPAPGS